MWAAETRQPAGFMVCILSSAPWMRVVVVVVVVVALRGGENQRAIARFTAVADGDRRWHSDKEVLGDGRCGCAQGIYNPLQILSNSRTLV